MRQFREWLLRFFGEVGKFLIAVLKRTGEEAMDALLPIALKAVTRAALDPSLVTNDDKRNTALKEMGEEAKAAGINVGLSVLAWALETALQRLKASQEA